MSNWGIASTASEKEKIKAEYADELHGLNSVGSISYDDYSYMFDFGMELLDRMYEQGKVDARKQNKPMTNADRVRAMSDEELARVMVMCCVDCIAKPCKLHNHSSYDCREHIKNWLRQPVKEERHD